MESARCYQQKMSQDRALEKDWTTSADTDFPLPHPMSGSQYLDTT